MNRRSLVISLIVAAVAVQVALAAYLISISFQPKTEESVVDEPASNQNSKEDLEIAAEEKRHLGPLMNWRNLDTTSWKVRTDYFRHLQERTKMDICNFEGGQAVDDTTVQYLTRFPIARLILGDSQVTEDCLKDIGRMKDLHNLELKGLKLTTADVQPLAHLTSLVRLSMVDCHLNDDSVLLFNKHSLVELNLDRNSLISDRIVPALLTMPLRRVDLGGTSVTDAGVRELSQHKILKRLFLWSDAITDRSIPYLNKMISLEWLDLSETKVTDAGLKGLHPPRLNQLTIMHCQKVSTKALTELIKRSDGQIHVTNGVANIEWTRLSH